ncbi:MAG: hypothetical protein WC655_00235 [Candidatus Hydrogenedentales bacterium]|jgi:hypothetical protein
MNRFRRIQIIASMLLLGCVVMPSAGACSVPVFRWALERWQADHYELLVFHDKALSEGDQAALRTLEQRAKDPKAPANLEVHDIDVTQPIDEPYGAAWKQAQGAPLPACFLLYPRNAHIAAPVWSGPLNELRLDALMDSPVRRELAKRLLDGQSGVWLFLRSGDQAKDDAVAKLLSEQIDLANRTLQLPDLTGDETLEGPNPPDVSNLRVEFSVLALNRDDPEEAMLVRMLLGSEPDLREFREPMAFPVYGRGRVLYALVGKGINPDTVMKASAFLIGECACEIKAQNPGNDLIMPVDWEGGIGASLIGAVSELPPLPGTALPAVADSTEVEEPEPSAIDGGMSAPFMRTTALVAAAAVAVVAVGTLVSLARRRNTQ